MSAPKSEERVVPQRLSTVTVPAVEERFSTGIAGLDACLSESDDGPSGLPYGVSVLISGMPGGGKSTIVTYMANAQTGRDALYLHGEERAGRVRQRWDRLQLTGSDPFLAPLKAGEDAEESIREAAMERGLGVCILDSIQCLTWRGSRRYEDQFLAAEYLSGLVCAAGGSMIIVSHVDKTGKAHKGAAELAHMVDIHLHLTTKARTSERFLEVRKNRMGRAGFEVPVNISISGITVGAPAPLTPGGGLVSSRNKLEQAAEAAYAMLMDGRRVDGYDFDEAKVSGGMWRAGLSMTIKRMEREGIKVQSQKVGLRMTHWIEPEDLPSPPKAATAASVPDIASPVEPFPIEVD